MAFDVANLVARIKGDDYPWDLRHLWKQAVHGNCFHMYTRFDRETRTEVIEFFETETSASSLMAN